MRPLIAAAGSAALVLGMLAAGPAAAAPAVDWEAPFPCAAEWVGTTRSSHSPSVYSVDFNRPDDLGKITVATAPGVVSRVADTGGSSYGKYIIVDHGDGYSSLYAHLLAQYVTTGQRVDQGTILGQVGTSGGSTGPHLHFEQKLWSRVQRPYFHQNAYNFGTTLASRNCPDVPLAGDFNGKGADELAVFRRSPGHGIFRIRREGRKPNIVRLGYSSDTPVVGDWDGNGTANVGVRRSASNEWVLRTAGKIRRTTFGSRSDIPVTGDWDGDGDTQVGVWRPSQQLFRMRVSMNDVRTTRLGSAGAIPVTGDWNGDGQTDVGVYEPSRGTFVLRSRPIGPAAKTVALGRRTSLPVIGDWNGDGRSQVGVWAPGSATYTLRSPGGSKSTARFGFPRVR